MDNHVHICISIPPKYVVSNVVGYIKGKSATQIARRFGGRQKNFTGEHFWARGYFCLHGWTGREHGPGVHQKSGREDERYKQMTLAMG